MILSSFDKSEKVLPYSISTRQSRRVLLDVKEVSGIVDWRSEKEVYQVMAGGGT